MTFLRYFDGSRRARRATVGDDLARDSASQDVVLAQALIGPIYRRSLTADASTLRSGALQYWRDIG